MSVISNIRKDIALRNATVYAQWFGILTAVSCIVTRVYWLITSCAPDYFILSEQIATLARVLDMIFFPLPLFLTEIPLRPRRWRRALDISLIYYLLWCAVRTILGFTMGFLDRYSRYWDGDDPALFTAYVVVSTILSLATIVILMFSASHLWGGTYSSGFRALFYAGYTYAIVTGARGQPFGPPYRCQMSAPFYPPPRIARAWHFEPAMVSSALAAVAYLVAYCLGHEHVFGRTLGGPGVELMPLVHTGPFPWEGAARWGGGGAIRL